MCDIDEIMDMLDGRNSEEIQQKGLALAKNVKCINAFVKPADVNVWGNCAKILAEKPDEILAPYSSQLITWIRDLGQPGAMIILRRLLEFSDVERFASGVEYCVGRFTGLDEPMWLSNIAELLENSKLKEELDKDVLEFLQNNSSKYRELFWDNYDEQEDKIEYDATTFQIIRQEREQIACGESLNENLINIYVPEAISVQEIAKFIVDKLIHANQNEV